MNITIVTSQGITEFPFIVHGKRHLRFSILSATYEGHEHRFAFEFLPGQREKVRPDAERRFKDYLRAI